MGAARKTIRLLIRIFETTDERDSTASSVDSFPFVYGYVVGGCLLEGRE